jgi:hypothetical protein
MMSFVAGVAQPVIGASLERDQCGLAVVLRKKVRELARRND